LNLVKNDLAWTKFANIVFLEHPVGVGFSYSNHFKDYSSNDVLSAKDNLAFLIEFFKVFPEFKSNKMYLTGESYAGHYVPMWLNELIAHNKKHNNEFNLRGVVLLNPLISYFSGDPAEMETYWGHQRIPLDMWEKYKKHRCGTARNRECRKVFNVMHDTEKHMNPYAIDFPICATRGQQKQLSKFTRKLNKYDVKYEKFEHENVNMSCIDKYTDKYLNSKAVRQNVIKPHSNRNWYACTNYEFYRYKDGNNDMVKHIKKHLTDKDLQHLDILIMSGTNDSVCGTVGTQRWISRLKLKVKANTQEWKPYLLDNRLKGNVTIFEGDGKKTLTLATVNHAGHEIPLYQPAVSYYLVDRFVKRISPMV
jgi:carboxypeptidase C (cathepsin A)